MADINAFLMLLSVGWDPRVVLTFATETQPGNIILCMKHSSHDMPSTHKARMKSGNSDAFVLQPSLQ